MKQRRYDEIYANLAVTAIVTDSYLRQGVEGGGYAIIAVCLSFCHSSSSRMRVIYHNWSATKQSPHPQSVAEISRHSVLSGDQIRQCETSSGSRHKDTDQCL